MKKITLIALSTLMALVAVSNVHARKAQASTVSPSTTLSANIVMPDRIYCPAGTTCAFPAPTFIVQI